MATTKARNQGGDDQDVEGHGSKLRGPEGARQPRGPEGARQPREPEGVRQPRETDDDTEGHQFLPNETLARGAALSREREIQRNLQKREVQGESRRPFFRKRKSG